jgi:hypothetical protein
MGLSDSRLRPTPGYLFPRLVLAAAGLPGSSTDLSSRAAPFHPVQPDNCSYPFLHCRFWLHRSLADWPLQPCVTRPFWVRVSSLRLASSPHKASPARLLVLSLARLLVQRAIDKISSFQNIRSARLILALQRTQRTQCAGAATKAETGISPRRRGAHRVRIGISINILSSGKRRTRVPGQAL